MPTENISVGGSPARAGEPSRCTDLYKSKIWPASQYGQAQSAIATAAVVNRCPIARFPGDGAFPLLLRHHRAESRRFFAAGHSVDNGQRAGVQVAVLQSDCAAKQGIMNPMTNQRR